ELLQTTKGAPIHSGPQIGAEAQAALSSLAQMTSGGEGGVDLSAIKDQLGALMDVFKQASAAGPVGGQGGDGASKAEVERLMNLQGELTQKYREMSRYLSNQIVDQVNMDLSVVVKDLESGVKVKI